eukprot:6209707-Pleurochrysis_carterae.AAC.1
MFVRRVVQNSITQNLHSFATRHFMLAIWIGKQNTVDLLETKSAICETHGVRNIGCSVRELESTRKSSLLNHSRKKRSSEGFKSAQARSDHDIHQAEHGKMV